MKTYILMHKDIVVSAFKLDGNIIKSWTIPKSKIAQQHMPLPLRRIVHYINGGYIEKESDKSYNINDEGIIYLDIWLNDRAIPINRQNIDRYVKNKKTLQFMLENHSCSLTDCYWTKEHNEVLCWNDVKLYNSSKIDKLQVINKSIEKGDTYKGVNATIGGQLEKYWYYSYSSDCSKSNLMLAKKTNINDSVLNVREIIANKIYELQGYKNYCKYNYIRNKYGQIVGCKCRAFTNEKLELITAYDLLAEFGHEQFDDTYNLIIKYACQYGANKAKVIKQLDIQTLVDYIITNRDRHQNNLGFLRDPDTLRIVAIAPIFDSGSSPEMEWLKPYGVTNTTVHNLYNTELECLQSVKNLRELNLDKLPSRSWIKNEFSKASNMNIILLDKYISLYDAKINYLKELQLN